ncbi:MAG: hypothetical protein HY781_13690 [Chloroflexi bacterium]|nr:hypothetical protein [Chloroflexota bacterium]
MTYNATWEFETLAQKKGSTLPAFLMEFKLDLSEMIQTCPIVKLSISRSGNSFVLLDKKNVSYTPPKVAGLYCIFTPDFIVYYGEASDLYRRQLIDPDNTADSGKRFSNQGRAILKLILHKNWHSAIGLNTLFMQLFPGNCRLSRHNHQTFDECYELSEYSKSLEGVMGLFINGFYPALKARLMQDKYS